MPSMAANIGVTTSGKESFNLFTPATNNFVLRGTFVFVSKIRIGGKS